LAQAWIVVPFLYHIEPPYSVFSFPHYTWTNDGITKRSSQRIIDQPQVQIYPEESAYAGHCFYFLPPLISCIVHTTRQHISQQIWVVCI